MPEGRCLAAAAGAMTWAGPSGSNAAVRCSGSSDPSWFPAAGAAINGALVIGR